MIGGCKRDVGSPRSQRFQQARNVFRRVRQVCVEANHVSTDAVLEPGADGASATPVAYVVERFQAGIGFCALINQLSHAIGRPVIDQHDFIVDLGLMFFHPLFDFLDVSQNDRRFVVSRNDQAQFDSVSGGRNHRDAPYSVLPALKGRGGRESRSGFGNQPDKGIWREISLPSRASRGTSSTQAWEPLSSSG